MPRSKAADPVNPAHYKHGIEAIEVIESWKLDFCLGNCVKYVCRAGHKGTELEDLQKAAWYLKRRIDQLQGAQT